MKTLVAFYSRTGVSARAARLAAAELRSLGAETTIHEIRERFGLPYPLWLLLSFIPSVGWPIMGGGPDPREFDSVMLVTPKWTLACPPVESWLRGVRGGGKPAALVVACGGFDQERYAGVYAGKLKARGFDVRAAVTVKKKLIKAAKTREAIRGAAEALVKGMGR